MNVSTVPRVPLILTKLLALATLLVVLAGAAVTSTESGMADKSWPTFVDRWYPSPTEMFEDKGKFFEHGHRTIAGLVVLFTWGIAILLTRSAPGGGSGRLLMGATLAAAVGLATYALIGLMSGQLIPVRAPVVAIATIACGLVLALHLAYRTSGTARVGWCAAGMGLLPALLGGLTVLYNTPPELSAVHVGFAMLFLGFNTSLAVVTGTRWNAAMNEGVPEVLATDLRWLFSGSVILTVAIFIQIILGAVLRHADRGIVLHVMWAFVVLTVVCGVTSRVFARHGTIADLLRPSVLLMAILFAQFFFGVVTYITRPNTIDEPGSDLHQMIATLHQVAGAVMWMAAIVLALRLARFRSRFGAKTTVDGAVSVVNAAAGETV